MLDVLSCHHLSHIGSAGGVADHSGTSADKDNRLVACHLESLHKAKSHKVTNVERVRSGVKANVERGFAVIDHFLDFVFVCYLGDKASGNEFFINLHFFLSVTFLERKVTPKNLKKYWHIYFNNKIKSPWSFAPRT